MIELVLEQIEITCSNEEQVFYTIKVCSIVEIDIIEYVEIIKVPSENMRNTFSMSWSGI